MQRGDAMKLQERFTNKVCEKILLAESHPQLLALWSPENTLSPHRITAGSHKKARWRCALGHTWEAPIYAVAAGSGCPCCAGKQPVPGQNDLATLRPDLMAQWDPENNTLDPGTLTAASHKQVWWKCPQGHRWQAAVFARTRENAAGCPYCTGKKALPGFNDLASRFPELALQWHPELNGTLTPEQLTPGSNKKVWWRCAAGHSWQAAVYSRTRQRPSGCPVCAGTVRAPKPTISRHQPRAPAHTSAAAHHIFAPDL